MPRCCDNQEANFVCVHKLCNKPNPFICNSANSKCQNDHRYCPMIQWIIFKQKLQIAQKNNSLKKFEIIKLIQQSILRSLQNFYLFKSKFDVTNKINYLFQSIKQNKENIWTGRLLDAISGHIEFKNTNSKKKSDEKIQEHLELIQTKAEQLKQRIDKIFEIKTIKDLTLKQIEIQQISELPYQSHLMSQKQVTDNQDNQSKQKQRKQPSIKVPSRNESENSRNERLQSNTQRQKSFLILQGEEYQQPKIGKNKKHQEELQIQNNKSQQSKKIEYNTERIKKLEQTVNSEKMAKLMNQNKSHQQDKSKSNKSAAMKSHHQEFQIQKIERQSSYLLKKQPSKLNMKSIDKSQKQKTIKSQKQQNIKSQKQKSIRQSLPRIKIQQKTMKQSLPRIKIQQPQPQQPYIIKQQYLRDLNQKLQDLTIQPTNLELKFDGNDRKSLLNFAKIIKTQKFKNVKYLTIYYPWSLQADHYQQNLCASLLTLPQLKQCLLISNGVQSTAAFINLGKKFKWIDQKGWRNKQDWD